MAPTSTANASWTLLLSYEPGLLSIYTNKDTDPSSPISPATSVIGTLGGNVNGSVHAGVVGVSNVATGDEFAIMDCYFFTDQKTGVIDPWMV